MSLKRTLELLEQKVAALAAEQAKPGRVVIIRMYSPSGPLTHYVDSEGRTWPLDESRWPKLRAGQWITLREVHTPADAPPLAPP